ncbi:hypothetical protein SV7mr_10760 [Stieleria bergensis]|uniref:Transglutaminase-like superfamily protein n=1 Tax=Stieleria bergensis TaxID=2528025 RepID=A0A517SR71_9BACT|nr:hypothetical protein SV7mr_10760 [Planctomycetes bacterium SV_7m_r]
MALTRIPDCSGPHALSFQIRGLLTFPLTSLVFVLAIVGCGDDRKAVQQIQLRNLQRNEDESNQDHLAGVFDMLPKYVNLNGQQAQQQIAYRLNRWVATQDDKQDVAPVKSIQLIDSVKGLLSTEQLDRRFAAARFNGSDALHLRDCYLFHHLYSWIDSPAMDQPILADWFQSLQADLPEEQLEQLRTSSRLFDWTVRNIRYEPDELSVPGGIPTPELPSEIAYGGPGYRQTLFKCALRGTGDGLQRAAVFTMLCNQAGIPAAVIGTIDPNDGQVTPAFCGALIGKQIYLFEPRLGIHVPGPGQEGIATLAQARTDELVLRRLSIAGLDQFKYPVSKSDVQQCVALLNVKPEMLSQRMRRLEAALTGNRRINVFVDADQWAQQFDASIGISDVKVWDVPLLAERYQVSCEAFAERKPAFSLWHAGPWIMLEGDFDMAKTLREGRWQHLCGVFQSDELERAKGARTLYLEERSPSFEIDELRNDVNLQIKYGVRRPLNTNDQQFNSMILEAQSNLRLGKYLATYWLALLQADDELYETAKSWLDDRVLSENLGSRVPVVALIAPAARYNSARVDERLGEFQQAMEAYKREDEPQEHGNRIRARLVAKYVETLPADTLPADTQ